MNDELQDSTMPKSRRSWTKFPTSQEEADAIAWVVLGTFFVFCLWAVIAYRSQRSQFQRENWITARLRR